MIPPELIEAVAREACKQMGLDADEPLCLENSVNLTMYVAYWRVFEDDARKAIAFARAVKLCDTEGKG